MEDFESSLSLTSLEFINKIIPDKLNLQQMLWNNFHRITLVNKTETERLTLDIGLNFDWKHNSKQLPNIIIGELKQEKVNRKSPFMRLLKENGIRPFKISKYCIGAKYMHPELKNNRFKEKHLYINKLSV